MASSKFPRQPEKSQATLGTAAKAGNPKATFSRSMPSSMSSLANTKSAAGPAKFSENTEHLQEINSIRKAPVGAQIKRVINLLFKTREALTPDQINKACYVDVNGNKAVFDSLRNNPKVRYDGERFSYKSKHQLQNKTDLLQLIRTRPEGIAVIDLKDSYTAVLDDLQTLKGTGEIWLLSNFDSQEDIAYPNDPRASITVDDDLKQLFRGIELPRDMLDIERDLQKNGMKPATNTAKRRAAAEILGMPPKPKTKKKKNHEISKRTKLTNAHLPELFQTLRGPG
ncbi:uncharacterized protein LOC130985309 isoform X2 [Salvia miltiorrhiza]|nr:uncharacterized protein LOC130985309 isoform X2 [Salvia miltiorrhiza]XP_057764228.1 uncharacterized protein LOC130985309 isoform X2 [Salvia miltiorrhiza]XP_057764237.1 uncharacterized protein LOC130985309 isoform X2 [Salvia miltiorrhiza]XP_057764245.1 uncharacterized protein LOC130985309 isoform X2 [Salvia miltiorrhiza]